MTETPTGPAAPELEPAASARIRSGHTRLDQILEGGLPAGGLTILGGAPGSGKTILAQQYAFHNATPEHPALYLSTVSEPLEKMLRYGEQLDFFDADVIGGAVRYHDLGGALQERGLQGVLDEIVELIKDVVPGIIVIDSFKALSVYAEHPVVFRRFLHDLAGWLSAYPASTFWVGEYDEDEISQAPEFAVADAILQLGKLRTATRDLRALTVLKLRGSGYLPGLHAYRVTSAGLDVYPRLADVGDPSNYANVHERQSSGVQALDEMLEEGYWIGSSTLCAGPSGAGKTLMGLHFIFRGAARGERGIIATLQENPTQLTRIASGFGWTLDASGVDVMYRSPVDVHIDQWVYDLLDAIERTGATRVLIDSLTDLQFASADDIRFREFMYSLTQRCARHGISLFMTTEIPDLFNVNALSQFGVSHLSDNIVLLQYVESEERGIERAITVLKTRASAHRPEVRRFQITADGVVLSDDG